MEHGESFFAWVKGDKSAFLLWVQTMVNDNNTEDSRKVNLLPSKKNNIEIRTTCKIHVDDDHDDGDDDSSEPERVERIELTNMRIVQLKLLARPLTVRIPQTSSWTSAASGLRL